MQPKAEIRESSQGGFVIEFPDSRSRNKQLSQDQEWCVVKHAGVSETIRFHDYGRIYRVPGLYEQLFYKRLRCTSPRTVVGLLRETLQQRGVVPDSLRGLDVGAGNGMVGEELRNTLGVETMVGVDIITEASEAAQRDRPGVYRDYVVADLTDLEKQQQDRIEAIRPNLLTSVAALGFGDIPAPAFARAWELISTPAWVAFNIKETFLDAKADQSGFSLLIHRMIDEHIFELKIARRYRHRLSLAGEPLYYVALVGAKRGSIPDDWFLN